MEGIALDVRPFRCRKHKVVVEGGVMADQYRPFAVVGFHGLADGIEHFPQGLRFVHRISVFGPGVDAREVQRGLFQVGAFEGLTCCERVSPRCSQPSSSMVISTAATSSRASVRELNPPVSTSTTTGRNPRKRRAMGWTCLLASSVTTSPDSDSLRAKITPDASAVFRRLAGEQWCHRPGADAPARSRGHVSG